jgi:hypothetical protein
VVVGAEPADATGRDADHGAGFAVPGALTVRPRADVDRVLQHSRDRAVVLGRDEEDGVGGRDLLLECDRRRRRVGVVVLVVEGQLADLDDLERERRRRHGDQRLGELAVERALAKAADDDRDAAGAAGHGFVLGGE